MKTKRKAKDFYPKLEERSGENKDFLRGKSTVLNFQWLKNPCIATQNTQMYSKKRLPVKHAYIIMPFYDYGGKENLTN